MASDGCSTHCAAPAAQRNLTLTTAVIELRQAQLRRGAKQLFNDAQLRIHADHKVGLIGANGSGKSSLFKLLCGQLSLDAGELSMPASWRVAHMAQEVEGVERTALDYLLDGDQQLRAAEAQIAAAAANGDDQRLAEGYQRLDEIDGYTAANRAEQLLDGLGFAAGDGARQVGEFSGGWQIRLNLARALIARSDLLLLDEPTNHLDLDATLWLERWLQRYAGTLVIISHDRDFLDAVVNRIVRIEGDSLVSYSGNYSSYERIRAERLALQAAMAEKQRVRRSEVEAFVARFRYKASKARQAQSRLKELARMDEIAAAHVDSPFSFRFPDSPTGSGALLNLSQATLGYPGRTVLEGVNLELQPGARIGLLGANGAGKTTLIKTLTAELALVAGERIEGTRLRIGYFAQQQLEALDVAASPLLHLQRLPESGEERASEQKMRDFLGGFDFRGDAVEAPVRDFSGGEKARLALALIIWQRPNLLLLDEPTNHLDIDMRQALAEALNAYQGALVLISHDRHLLRNSVDQFYLVADGALQPFDGDLHDYQHRLAEPSSAAAVAPAAVVAAPDRRADRQAAAQRRAELAPLRKQQQQIERQLQTLNEQLEAVEQWLSAPDAYSDDNRAALKAKLAEQGEWRRQLHSAEETWLEIAAILEQN